MKIIALLPVKNEEWALPSYLSSVSKIADEIIALDDSSSDATISILESAGAKVIRHDFGTEKVVNMGARRQVLLDAGRRAGGTHFIWLDADETFSSDFISTAREYISKLEPGQKLTLRWLHLWKNLVDYVDDKNAPFGYIWKDFVVCDDGVSNFNNQFLSEARTQGDWGTPLVVPESIGVVLHWQFSRWDMVQYKQAWYRCTELVEGTRSARRINNTYKDTLDKQSLVLKKMPGKWKSNLVMPSIDNAGVNWHKAKILEYFDSYGVEYFEPLQIWHIPELHKIFIEKIDREPKSKTFPKWLIILNKIRRKIL